MATDMEVRVEAMSQYINQLAALGSLALFDDKERRLQLFESRRAEERQQAITTLAEALQEGERAAPWDVALAMAAEVVDARSAAAR